MAKCPVCLEPVNDQKGVGCGTYIGVCDYCYENIPVLIIELAFGRTPKEKMEFPYSTDDWFLHPEVVKRLNEVDRAPQIHVPGSKYSGQITLVRNVHQGELTIHTKGCNSGGAYLYPKIVSLGQGKITLPSHDKPAPDSKEGMIYNPIDGKYRWL